MAMNLFKKIGDLIDGMPDNQEQEEVNETKTKPIDEQSQESSGDSKAEEKTSSQPQTSNNIKGENSIDTEEMLFDAIVKVFDSVYKGKKDRTNGKVFTLWVADNLLFDMVSRPDFSNQLITLLADEGYQTNWNAVKLEIPLQNHTFTFVTDRVFLQVESKETIKPVAKKAKVMGVQGKGSLLQDVYLLNSEERQRYNIGVGAMPDMQGKGVRENYIAIDDNAYLSQYDNNKYVSRAHAYIGFSNDCGFYLQVEAGGSRVHSGSRTRIFRGDEAPIELENLELPEPLKHGDLIELSKSVVLRFEEIKD